MLPKLKSALIGTPLPTQQLAEKRLNKVRALAAVVLPGYLPARWWHALLHNQTSLLIKTALLYRQRTSGYQRIIIDVPYRLKK
jgi:hypothetical protein